VPVPGAVEEIREYSRITEGFEIVYESENPFRGHGRGRSRCHCCGKPHSIPLGRLRYGLRRWTVDRRFRRPRVT
jgi:hypothetical protein